MADLISILWADVIALNLLLDWQMLCQLTMECHYLIFVCYMADVNAISG